MNRLLRLIKIISVVLRYRLDTLTPFTVFPAPKRPRGERLRLALESLGPIFVKFGQLLSTRRDLLPEDIADELALLQDQVPPFSEQQALIIIEKSLGKPVNDVFSHFEHSPFASASIAQIHAATLKSGEDVVIKVVRPGIDKTIQQDISLLFLWARFIQRFLSDGKRLRPVEVIEDYQHTILDELDLQKEGANTTQLRRNFTGSDLLYVPEIYWNYTSHNVLIMERIHGIPVTDIAALRQQNTNMKALAERGVEIFFTQLLRDNFFHADMHPGNIFISRDNPESPQYIAIDCAIIGSLSDSDQYYLARNLLAIFKRDYHLVAQLHIECGWVPKHTKAQDFESAMRSVCEPIFEKPIGEISLGKLLIYLFQTARRFDMEVQPSLVLLQKTLLNIEGLGKELYPQLNLWDTAQPYLEKWLKERYSPRSMYRKVQNRLPGWLEQLPTLPDTLFDALQQQQAIQQQLRQGKDQLQQNLRNKQKRQRRLKAVIISLLAIAGLTSPEFMQLVSQLSSVSQLCIVLAAGVWVSI